MSDLEGLGAQAPEEGGGAGEKVSEEAKQRFAAAQAALQQIRKEEKKSKRRDDQVAKMIIQFLGEEGHAHLFVLVSRLVARDCPSPFILAVLSLIHAGCTETVREYLKENGIAEGEEVIGKPAALMKTGEVDPAANAELLSWIARMQLVLSVDPRGILLKLMIDETNVDGTVLQLTTFVLQEFFASRKREIPFAKLQPLTAGILQTVFEPFFEDVRKLLIARREEQNVKADE